MCIRYGGFVEKKDGNSYLGEWEIELNRDYQQMFLQKHLLQQRCFWSHIPSKTLQTDYVVVSQVKFFPPLDSMCQRFFSITSILKEPTFGCDSLCCIFVSYLSVLLYLSFPLSTYFKFLSFDLPSVIQLVNFFFFLTNVNM